MDPTMGNSHGNEITEDQRTTAERRRQILDQKRSEFEALREEVRSLRLENESLRSSRASEEESEALREAVAKLEKEKEDYKTLVVALKNVNVVAKQMIQLRESQIRELGAKLDDIEKLIPKERENVNIRREYEKQLVNIRNLKVLYEEKQRAEKRERDALQANVDALKEELHSQIEKNSEQTERIAELEEKDSRSYDEIKRLESSLGLARADAGQLEAELAVINRLFSDVLVADLDRLHGRLEQHHDLLTSIASEASGSASAMPKALLDLVRGLEQDEGIERATEETRQTNEIAEKLPKVWKVLIELLSHHQAIPSGEGSIDVDDDTSCYKTVEGPKGPNLVLSVSKTFIRLKGLIMEKKALTKEMARMKELNRHLEKRLLEQETKLSGVQSEVSKTWHLVGKIQKQHRLLHTQEKVLRYELAQKRKLLNELKEELESGREKWAQAREKNDDTAHRWRLLREEFASRREENVTRETEEESGFSDEGDDTE